MLKAWDKTSAVDVGQEGRVLEVKIELEDETRADGDSPHRQYNTLLDTVSTTESLPWDLVGSCKRVS